MLEAAPNRVTSDAGLSESLSGLAGRYTCVDRPL